MGTAPVGGGSGQHEEPSQGLSKTRLRGSAKASRLPSQEPAVPFYVDARGKADDLPMPFKILAHGASELLRSKMQN